jgi:integrase
MTDNPAAKVAILKSPEGNRRPFTLPELRAILAVATPEWRGIVLTGFYTGQRLKDVASLTWANVDLERSEIRLATSKTGRRQVIPIAKPLREFFESLPSSDNARAPIFPKAYPLAGRDRGTSMLSEQFRNVLVSAGVVPPRPPKRQEHGGL